MMGYIAHTLPRSGEVAAATQATQFPTALQMPCKRVYLRARSNNGTHSPFIGFTSGVTTADGTTDATTGIELAAGDQPLIIDIQHTNQIYYICSSTTAHFTVCILT